MIRSVIIDDEVRSCHALAKMLREYCRDVDVVGMAHTVDDGVGVIRQEQPSLVFLDIQMPGGNGFQLLNNVAASAFKVVFVTAYDNYALTAFRYEALDYLLKPIDIDDLVASVNRFRTGYNSNAAMHNHSVQRSAVPNVIQPLSPPCRIAVATSHDIQFIEVENILRLQSERNYTTFHLTDGSSLMVARTLKEYEETLGSVSFFRIHQSHIINLKKVVRYIKGKGGYAVLCDGSTVEVSPARKVEFLKQIQHIAVF